MLNPPLDPDAKFPRAMDRFVRSSCVARLATAPFVTCVNTPYL